MTKKIVALVAKSIEANNALLESLNEYLAEEAVTEKTVAKAPAKKAPAKKVVEEVAEEAPAKKAPASKKAPATKKAPAKKVVEEVEEEEEEGAVEGELPEGFDTMKLPELKAFAKENGIRIPKDTKIAVVRDLIREGLGLEEEVDEEEEVEEEEAEMSENTITYEDEDGEVTVDLEDMDVKGLKAFAKEFDIKVPVKLKTKASIIEFLMEAFEEEADEEEADEEDVEDVEADEDVEEEENPEVAYGLDEMSTEELADLLRDHELKATGKRSQLVARIVEAIEDGTIETEEEEGE